MRPQRNAAENLESRTRLWDLSEASMRPQRNAAENEYSWSQRYLKPLASMRPQRNAAENKIKLAMLSAEALGFNEAAA